MSGLLLAIVLAPLAVAVVLAVGGGVLRVTGAPGARGLADGPGEGGWLRAAAGWLSVGGVFVSFILGLVVFFAFRGGQEISLSATWFQVGSLQVPFSLKVDGLQSIMVMVVTGVSLLVHLFSNGYMRGDRDIVRYFAELSLFSAAMLLLVLANDFFVLYVGWELVGASSYLLIAFYFERPAAAAAGKKAFITTRIGDLGLLIGIFAIVHLTGSLDFDTVFGQASGAGFAGAWRVVVPLLVFTGAVGKSAQFPLHVWLPDAMEGPTPVSALLHAATMVAAGVYLVARTFPLFAASSEALTVVGWIGAVTALFAATVAATQRDIKKVLAYSTISQLGFMMTALGAGAPVAAIFHLFTHAWFKALLFLAAGSIIHATGRQVVDELGGLRRRMPVTALAFASGALALAGIPPFAGFWSKEEILGAVSGHPAFLVMLLAAAFLTAFYITRVGCIVFLGPEIVPAPDVSAVRAAADPHGGARVRESGPVMTVPLVVLGLLALLAGFAGAGFLGSGLQHFLDLEEAAGARTAGPAWVSALAIVLAVAGVVLAWAVYGRGARRVVETPETEVAPSRISFDRPAARPGRPGFDARLERRLGRAYRLAGNAYYVDVLYARLLVPGYVAGSRVLAARIDVDFIDAIVNGVAFVLTRMGAAARRVQTGEVRDYVAAAAVGAVIVAALVVGALK